MPPIADAIADQSATVLVAEHRGELLGLCTAYLDLNSVRFGPALLGRGPGRRPRASLAGSGEGAARRGEGAGRASEAPRHLELDSGDARDDAHRFYEREDPSWRSVCFAWELSRRVSRENVIGRNCDLLRYIALARD